MIIYLSARTWVLDTRKCRNWQTSKTKDLVHIACVWVQVPSSARKYFSKSLEFTGIQGFFVAQKYDV